jgi:tetratricopeptide (TPR) repeat protein
MPPQELDIVRNGRPTAEIILADEAMPQARLAAQELRDHILKISGAELAITNRPSGNLYPIYVGESAYTRGLKLDLNGIDKEGYRIVAKKDYMALMGRDKIFPFYPRGHIDRSVRQKLLEEWQTYAGEKWDFPFLSLYDPRNFNKEFGFSLFDPSGTLFAVYDFLEQIGVRWYLPYACGTVIPELRNVTAARQDVTRRPAFEQRYLRVGWGNHKETFLWSKRQKLGLSELAMTSHGTPLVTVFNKQAHPEYFAVIGGKPDLQDIQNGPGTARLAPPLKEAMIRYGNKFFERYPELRHMSAAPNDGYVAMDDRDRETGWLREQYGERGKMSDYAWTFVNEVAQGMAKTHPDKVVMGLAYSGYRKPPPGIPKLASNVGATYCQTRAMDLINPVERAEISGEREEWLRKLPSGEFYIWEYFLWHQKGEPLWGVPVIFTRIMQTDMQALRGKSRGEYVEAWPLQGGEMWGIDHLTINLQARLYWEPGLDLEKFMNEYCRLFYGPAAAEMREFFNFAEEVWMRTAPRQLGDGKGFLQPADVERYFEILERARNLAGQTIYGERIDLIIKDCQPMRQIFAFRDFYRKGQAAAKAKDGAAAAEYLDKAVAAAQENRGRANAAYELGNACRDLLHDDERALAAYRLAMQTQIEGAGAAVRSHARMAAVEILRKTKRHEEALKLLDEAPGMRQHDYWWARVLAARGVISEDLGRNDEAAARYREALALTGIDATLAKSLRKKLENIEGPGAK